MNWDVVQGDWKQLKGKAREKWGKVTDDEWDEIHGNFEQFVGKLQEKYGYARDEAERQANDWAEQHSKSAE